MDGTMELHILDVHNVDEMYRAARDHNPAAQVAMDGLADFLNMQRSFKRGKSPLCLMCEHEFHNKSHSPAAFVVMVPMFPQHTDRAFMTPLCGRCYSSHAGEALLDAVIGRLTQMGLDFNPITMN